MSKTTLLFFLIFLSSPAWSQSILRYEGYIENSGVAVDSPAQTFTVSIMKQGCPIPLISSVGVVTDIINGEFNINPSFAEPLFSQVMNPNYVNVNCPSINANRLMRINWLAETFDVAINESARAGFSNIAGLLNERNQHEFLKIASYPSQAILSNVQVDTLLGLVNGTATNYLRPSDAILGDVTGPSTATVVSRIRGTNVVATAPTTGQVLKFVAGSWTPSPDETGGAITDASYAAKGVVQGLTDEATSGLRLTAGVLSLGDVGTPGTYGSATQIPVIMTDNKGRVTSVVNTTVNDATKLPLVGGTISGAINMSNQNITNVNSIAATNFSGRNLVLTDNDINTATIRTPTDIVANYILTLPPNDGAAGEILTTDGAGVLSWAAPAVGAGDITEVLAGTGLTGGATTGSAILNVNTGSGPGQIPTLGSALGNQGVMLVNNMGNALVSLNCTNGQVLKFNVSGFATCGSDEIGVSQVRFPANDLTPGASIAIGNNALNSVPALAAYNNVAIGYESMTTTLGVTAINNVGVGFRSLRSVTSGDGNVAVGKSSLTNLTTGFENTAVGSEVMTDLTTGNNNTAIGNRAGRFLTGAFNTTVGQQALENAQSFNNTAVGSSALQFVNTGAYNTAVGSDAGNSLSTGSNNTFLGHGAGDDVTTGNSNVVIGFEVGGSNMSSGDNNILIGTDSSVTKPAIGTNNYVNIGNLITGNMSPTFRGIEIDGKITSRVSASGGSLSNLFLDFGSTNFIRVTSSGACGALNLVNLTPGGSYTITMPNATTTCGSISYPGFTVRYPQGYMPNQPAGGLVYTFIFDGVDLWATAVPF